MGTLPRVAEGKQKVCDICGYWYGERSGKLFKRRGLLVCKQDYDKLTEEERISSIKH